MCISGVWEITPKGAEITKMHAQRTCALDPLSERSEARVVQLKFSH